MTLQPSTPVWRYMSFAKYVYLLQTKQLWLSNAKFFDDKWEGMFIGQQLNTIVNNRPASVSAEDTLESAKDLVTKLKKQAYINCWTASEDESHALWRLYCHTAEGVAIQTTLDRLQKSVGVPVLEVNYNPRIADSTTPDPLTLVTQKRPMFAYEQEVRLVLIQDFDDPRHPERITFGSELRWDPELHLENIWVHPEAQSWFMESVTEITRLLAPKICGRVWWSKMNSSPPF